MILISKANEPIEIEEVIKARGIPYTLCTIHDMPYGDYVWGDVAGNSVAVEHKGLNDFLTSMQSGRLEEQLAGCLEEYDKTILLVRGMFFPKKDGTIQIGRKGFQPPPAKRPYRSIPAAMISLQANGIDVVTACDLEGAGHAIVALYEYTQKHEHTLLQRYIRQKPRIMTVEPKVEVLVAISRVVNARLSLASAGEILNRFETVKHALDNVDKWQYIRGVGPKTVEKFKEILNGNPRRETR